MTKSISYIYAILFGTSIMVKVLQLHLKLVFEMFRGPRNLQCLLFTADPCLSAPIQLDQKTKINLSLGFINRTWRPDCISVSYCRASRCIVLIICVASVVVADEIITDNNGYPKGTSLKKRTFSLSTEICFF